MTGARKLTDEQIEQLVAWRERGWGYTRIATELGVSDGAIHYQCLKHGAVSPKQRRRPVPTEPTMRVASDGRTQTTFTQADDERLLALEAQGLKYPAIGRAMGRSYTSVRIRILTLALYEDIPFAAGRAG